MVIWDALNPFTGGAGQWWAIGSFAVAAVAALFGAGR
jgi:hypothetical protein